MLGERNARDQLLEALVAELFPKPRADTSRATPARLSEWRTPKWRDMAPVHLARTLLPVASR